MAIIDSDILFFSGVQLLSLGVIGRYVAEIYLETKIVRSILLRMKNKKHALFGY